MLWIKFSSSKIHNDIHLERAKERASERMILKFSEFHVYQVAIKNIYSPRAPTKYHATIAMHVRLIKQQKHSLLLLLLLLLLNVSLSLSLCVFVFKLNSMSLKVYTSLPSHLLNFIMVESHNTFYVLFLELQMKWMQTVSITKWKLWNIKS